MSPVSKQDKAVERLISRPTDFSWDELQSLMKRFGYAMKTTGGSGRKFTRPDGGQSFVIHEPHPKSILKAYQVREFLAFLRQEGHIE